MRLLVDMRRFCAVLILACLVVLPAAQAATGKVIKVLPFFVDTNGLHTLSPSLYERDAYQAYLRQNPERRSGVLYKIQWKSKGKVQAPLRLRVELRGVAQGNLPKQAVIERAVDRRRWFTQWDSLELVGEEYKRFGDVVAWRVTLWEGEDLLLGSQQSFLW